MSKKNNLVRNPQLSFLKHIKKDTIYNSISNIKPLRVGTECSGIEAPIMALELLNIPFIHQFSCDNDNDVKDAIMLNFKPTIFNNDIFTRDINLLPDIDIYICGFPCQSFSTAGSRLGFDKPNNEGIIFFECMKVIKKKQPNYFILENVKGLLTHNKGETIKVIIENLKKLKKYNIFMDILRTCDYNIPQKRDRLYIIGINKDIQKKEFQFPEKVLNITRNISKIINIDDILINKNKSKKNILSSAKQEIVKLKKQHYNIKNNENWFINLNASYPYATTTKDVCPCLVTTCNMVYATKYNRFLTTKECLRLQGFPDRFKTISKENKVYKQIGNSISVNVLCYLFMEIFRCSL